MPGAETPRPLRDTGEKGSKLQPGPVVHALPAEPGTHIVKAEADDPQLDGDALKEPEMNMSNKNGMYSAGTDTPRPAIKQQYEEAENLLCDLPSGPAGGEVQRVDDVRTSESAPSGWIPGTYVLINARSGTALDLQIGDQRSLIGFPMHGGPNQQWEFVPSGQGYMIRSALSVSRAEGLYLTVEDGIRDHAAVVASAFPVSWNVNQNEEGIIISWPNTDFVFGLADMGSSTPGTEVQLVKAKPGSGSEDGAGCFATVGDGVCGTFRRARLYYDYTYDDYHDSHHRHRDNEDAAAAQG
ncbi:hypothetical protein A0H81_06821 [Grifola frondosa]|uniref:Ricin B lectin domain-containing protein n=1 Tax=Grifola frondosa TaxID=5627 RepID=A0A1C7M7R2_GRIFR|nr:hypothetical protein A0H81_06821 [Grifola frondosa]